ncbi:hypothetical protein DL96DRAFT_1534153 [Flagelloscypha sp. PMI_526]|nr:hypothetical protein DL96DRAFT_1534153 [Flagelloscypha sp. PMI_526]
MNSPLPPYNRSSRGIAFGIDLGVSSSAISFAVLQPGESPTPQTVSRTPDSPYEYRVPSLCYYDGLLSLCALGVAAINPPEKHLNCVRVSNSTFFLAPPTCTEISAIHPKLPPLLSKVQIFADLFKHLVEDAQHFMELKIEHGDALWNETVVQGTPQFVVTYPNGWDGEAREILPMALWKAMVIPDVNYQGLHLVTEGDAALYYSMHRSPVLPIFQDGQGIIVIDSSARMTKFSSYLPAFVDHELAGRFSFIELTPPRNLLHGSTSVSEELRQYLHTQLKDSRLSSPDNIEKAVGMFNKKIKPYFSTSSTTPLSLQVGPTSISHAPSEVKDGILLLNPELVASFFDVVLDAILKQTEILAYSASSSISSFILTGGFMSNEFVYTRLRSYLEARGLHVYRPDTALLPKVTPEGALCYHLGGGTPVLASPFTFGIEKEVPFEREREHDLRADKKVQRADGNWWIGGQFYSILLKGSQVSTEPKEWRMAIEKIFTTVQFLAQELRLDLIRYLGVRKSNQIKKFLWMDEESAANFVKTVSLRVPMRDLKQSAIKADAHSLEGNWFWKVKLDIVLRFEVEGGLIGMLSWKDGKGAECRSAPEKIDLARDLVVVPS